MFIKPLINVYLTTGLYADCYLYRKAGIWVIGFYQIALRKFYSRECQFDVSCSRFFKEQLSGNTDFEDLLSNINIRMLDCSQPLDVSCSPKSGLIAVGVSKKKDRQDELAETFVRKFAQHLKNADH